MKLTKEQDKIVCRAFMAAMAKKLYRDGAIDIHKLNRLMVKIEKSPMRSDDSRESGERAASGKTVATYQRE